MSEHKISFNDNGDVIIESQTYKETISKGQILLDPSLLNEAKRNGWELIDYQIVEKNMVRLVKR